jgi:hypothetical protein
LLLMLQSWSCGYPWGGEVRSAHECANIDEHGTGTGKATAGGLPSRILERH